jgi:anti-sigma factor (TIGR02949 family)
MNVLNFRSGQCERVRERLDAYLSSELSVETTADVLKHLESCAACAAELESRTRVREALKRAVCRQPAPVHLEETVRRSLRQTRHWFWGEPRTAKWALAFASFAAVVLAGLTQQVIRVRSARQLIASVLSLGVSDHLHCAIQSHNYPDVANPPDRLRQALGPSYAGLLPVVREQLPDFEILEAHICSVPGSPRKYVHFIARGRGKILSVILTGRDGKSLPEGRFLEAKTSGGVNLYNARMNGTDVAGFESGQYFGFVVADLGKEAVLQIATRLAPPVRDELDQSG